MVDTCYEGLTETAALWSDVEQGYACILAEENQIP